MIEILLPPKYWVQIRSQHGLIRSCRRPTRGTRSGVNDNTESHDGGKETAMRGESRRDMER